MYLTFEEYASMGGTAYSAASAAYVRAEAAARTLIDRLTHGRVRNDDPVRDAVKYAMFDAIEMSAAEQEYNGRVIASASNDGVSVTYADSGISAQQRYAQAIRDWLINEQTADGVGLLYAGVDDA